MNKEDVGEDSLETILEKAWSRTDPLGLTEEEVMDLAVEAQRAVRAEMSREAVTGKNQNT